MSDASTKWHQPFDATITDVFAVQAEIAGQVARALDLVLGQAEEVALATRPTQNLSAYDMYLKGEAASGSLTRTDGIGEGIRYFERAVSLDSTFVEAWLQLTRAEAITYPQGIDPSPARRDRVRRAAERSASLSPSGYQGHWARAEYYGVLRNYSRGAAEIAAALRLVPADPELLRIAAEYEARPAR